VNHETGCVWRSDRRCHKRQCDAGFGRRRLFDWHGRAAVGAVGGFALGSALARPVYGPPPVYVERVYEARCFVERERVWVPGWGWEFRRRTICD